MNMFQNCDCISIGFLSLFSILAFGCNTSSEDARKTSVVDNKLSAVEIKRLVNKLPEQNYKMHENREKIKKSIAKKVGHGGQYYDYREETLSYENLFNDQMLLNADFSRIYPGSLVTEKSVLNSNLAKSELVTNPMRVGINIFYGGTIYADTVDCNSPGAVTTAMNKILTANPKGYHTNFYSKCAITNSYEEAMFKLNLNADWFSGSLRAEFKNTDSLRTQNIYFLLKDEYYQAFCENPNADKLLENSNNVKGDEKYFDAENQPLIVRSVSYGRIILLRSSISNSFLSKTFSGDIEHDFGAVSADAHVFLSNIKKLDLTNFEVMAYGGFKDINTDNKKTFDYLDSLIIKGKTPSIESPGSPISFRVETLKHYPYSVRSVVTDYVRTRWNAIPEAEFEIRFKNIKTLTPNRLSDAVIGSFITNGRALESGPTLPNNISFRDYRSPLNLSVGGATFAANNSVFVRVPLNVKGNLDISLEMTQLPDKKGKGNGPDIPAAGIVSFKVLDLLKRNQNVINEKVRATSSIFGINSIYEAEFDIIIDPKKEFNDLYNLQIAGYINQKTPAK